MDDNILYSFFAPFLAALWPHFGFTPVFLSFISDHLLESNLHRDRSLIHILNGIRLFDGYIVRMPSEISTLLPTKGVGEMTSRYFASALNFNADAYLILSDMDFLPLSKEWLNKKFDQPNFVTLWNPAGEGNSRGHGSCFIGARVHTWREVMNISSVKFGTTLVSVSVQDVFDHYNLSSAASGEQWAFDQIMFTSKLDFWAK